MLRENFPKKNIYLYVERCWRKAKRYLMTMKTGLGQDLTSSRTFTTNSCLDSNSGKKRVNLK